MNHELFNLAMNWQPNLLKKSGRWTFNTVEGDPWPLVFKSKKEALAMAMRHREAILERVRSERP